MPKTHRLLVWGEAAYFPHPDDFAETYPILTPYAAKNILECLYWLPAISWQIEEIHVLKPIQYCKGYCNGKYLNLLSDVAYLIRASLELTPKAGPNDKWHVHNCRFTRRAAAGKYFKQPYFGYKEFACHFRLQTDSEPNYAPIDVTKDLGMILYDVAYSNKSGAKKPILVDAYLKNGVLRL